MQESPEEILAQCDSLIRPHRRSNPWGRNIIEAMASGKPVLATGTYSNFVEDGVNGYLFPEFNAEDVAKKIMYLADDPQEAARMGESGKDKAAGLFGPSANIDKIENIYGSLINR